MQHSEALLLPTAKAGFRSAADPRRAVSTALFPGENKKGKMLPKREGEKETILRAGGI